MGEEKQICKDMSLKENGGRHVQWVAMEAENQTSESESIFEDSSDSDTSSSSSSDITEDASSSSSPSYGPLYELSELMAQLPIKRGLSKYYEGKSQSFGSLASVKSLEDLAKKGSCCKKRMKPCKSYGGGLDNSHKYSPKATITKKASSRGSFLSSLGRS